MTRTTLNRDTVVDLIGECLDIALVDYFLQPQKVLLCQFRFALVELLILFVVLA